MHDVRLRDPVLDVISHAVPPSRPRLKRVVLFARKGLPRFPEKHALQIRLPLLQPLAVTICRGESRSP